jgi:hypothetical protein
MNEMKRQSVKLVLVEPIDLKTPIAIGRETGAPRCW